MYNKFQRVGLNETWTLSQLRSFCKQHQITYSESQSRAVLIGLIKKHSIRNGNAIHVGTLA